MAEDTYSLRHRLAVRLRAARLAAGMTQIDVAVVTTWSTAKVNRYEKGVRPPNLADVMFLLPLLGVPVDQQEELIDLARRAREKSTYKTFSDILTPEQVGFFEAVSSATCVQETSAVVPLLLRTDAYCLAMDGLWEYSAPELARWQEFNTFVRTPPETESRQMTFILTESMLWRMVGGSEVMHEQLSYLWVLNRRKHLTIRVVPFTAGILRGILEPFALITHDDETLGARKLMHRPCILERDPTIVARMQTDFDDLWPASVGLETMLPQAFARLAA